MPYIKRIVEVPGHYKIVKVETSKGDKEVRKWMMPYKREIEVWVPESSHKGDEK